MRLSRRDFGIGALSAGALVFGTAARAPRPGVELGVQTYSYRDMLSTRGDMVAKMIRATRSLGLRSLELWDSSIQPPELAVGAPWYVARGGRTSAASVAGAVPAGAAAADQAARLARIRAWRMQAPLAYFTDIGRRLARAGIVVHSYSSDLKDAYTDEEIERTFEIARAVGARFLTTSTTLTMAQRTAPFAARHAICVGMHGHSNLDDPNQIATPESFEKCLEMSPWYRINLDIGHFAAAGFDCAALLTQHHARTVSIHLKDRRSNNGPNVPFGQGDTPIAEVVRLVRDRRWDIPLFLEYEYAGGGSVDELRRCRDYVYAALCHS